MASAPVFVPLSVKTLLPKQPLADMADADVLPWLDAVTNTCATAVDSTAQQQLHCCLPEVLKQVCLLMKLKIAFLQNAGASRAPDQLPVDGPTTPLYATLCQTISAISRHLTHVEYLPSAAEMLLGLLALAAVAPAHSQTAYVTAKALLRQQGPKLFSADGYTPQLHRWLREALRRGELPTSPDESVAYQALCAFEERKMAFSCIDAMVRSDCTLLVTVGHFDQELTDRDAAEMRFSTRVLDLLTVVEGEVIPSLREQLKPLPDGGVETNYYLSVAEEFVKRVYRAQVAKTQGSPTRRDSNVNLSNRKRFVDSSSSSPKGSPHSSFRGRPESGPAIRAIFGSSSPAASPTAAAAAEKEEDGEASLSASLRGSKERGSSRQLLKLGSKSIPLLNDVKEAAGQAQLAKRSSDSWTVEEAAERARAAITSMDEWPKRSIVPAQKILAAVSQFKEAREVELSLLSAKLAAAKERNRALSEEIYVQHRYLETLKTASALAKQSPSEGKTQQLAAHMVRKRIEELEVALHDRMKNRKEKLAVVRHALQQEPTFEEAAGKLAVDPRRWAPPAPSHLTLLTGIPSNQLVPANPAAQHDFAPGPSTSKKG